MSLSVQHFPCLSETNAQEPTIVLLHGWGVDQHCWESLLPDLQNLGPVSVIALAYDVENIDELCKRVQAEIKPKSVLVGWSLGGMLAARIAASFPEKVAALVTLASNQQFVASDAWPHAMPTHTYDDFFQLLQQQPQKALKRFLSLIVQGDELARILRRELAVPEFSHHLINGLKLLSECNNAQDYQKLTCPVLQCFGERDQLVPIAAMDALQQQYPHHQYHKLDNAGHCLHYPTERLSALLTLFLQGLPKEVSHASC